MIWMYDSTSQTPFFPFEHLESSRGTVVLTAVRLHVRCKGGKEKGGLI